jgi:hypothetical protein
MVLLAVDDGGTVAFDGWQITAMAIAVVIATLAGWAWMFHTLNQRPDLLTKLVASGVLLRMLALGFVLAAVTILGLSNRLSAEACTLLAGVSGYVLGGVRSARQDDSQPKEAQPQPPMNSGQSGGGT